MPHPNKKAGGPNVVHRFNARGNDNKTVCGAIWDGAKVIALIPYFFKQMVAGERFLDDKPCPKCLAAGRRSVEAKGRRKRVRGK